MKKRRFNWMMAAVLTICGAIMTLTSCKDDVVGYIPDNVVIPEGTNLMQLERYSYELPFEVQSSSEWKIEFDFDDDQICYALPDHGTGSQTVKLCVLDNRSKEKRTGKMYIDFPKDESKSQVIDLQQKGVVEGMLGADELPEGNNKYGVGYGYNTLGNRASVNSVMSSIIGYAKAIEDGKISLSPMDASFVAKTYSGSSVSELSNELSADASFGGKYLGFKGEVGASFDASYFSNEAYEYAICYVEADMQSVELKMDLSEIIDTYMTDGAYNAINGLPTKGRSGKETATKYPTTEEGLALLVQAYGTHLVTKARLGGCMKYSMSVDISKVEGNYDLKAFANCSYNNGFVKASMNVSDEYKQSYAQNSSAITTVVNVQGGSREAAVALAAANGDNDTNFQNWINSLADNQTIVGLDNSSFIPLYDLVDVSLTTDDDPNYGQHRYEALKAYINGDKIELDMSKALSMDYEMGDATHLASIPDFADESNDPSQSLIKDYYRGGQAVARICHEYIPAIDQKERVRVIYPIVSDKVKYNMGYFAGDATHRPAKVSWSSTGVLVESLDGQPMGAITELYMRGSNFFDSSNDSIVEALGTVDATIQPYTVSAQGQNGERDYSVVKIFNLIWMRENYLAGHTTGGTSVKMTAGTDQEGNYYSADGGVRSSDFAPLGWRVSSADDFRTIHKTINDDVTTISPAKAFFPDADGGVLGFYHRFNGRLVTGGLDEHGDTGYYGNLNKEDKSCDYIISIGKNESFGDFQDADWSDGRLNAYNVRLVHDIY